MFEFSHRALIAARALHLGLPDTPLGQDRLGAAKSAFFQGKSHQISELFRYARKTELSALVGAVQDSNAIQVATIEWSQWRLGLEYRLLHIRAMRHTTKALGWVPVAQLLYAAYGLALTDRAILAQKLLARITPDLPHIVDRIEMGTTDRAQLGAIGLFFEHQLGVRPDHPGFKDTPATLTQAIAARGTYAQASNPGGALMTGPEGDLIPLELIYLATQGALAGEDEILTQMRRAISHTSYPEDPMFQTLDTDFSMEGY